MTLRIFAVYDSASESYSPPVYMMSRGAALRSFMDTLQDAKSEWAKHPEHYTLFLFGDWDQREGKFALLDTPEVVAKAWELVQETSQNE